MNFLNPSLDITKIDFPGNQYVQKVTEKKTFVIHHSAGWDNARNMFHGWATDKKGRVCTAYGITDNGTIFQGFDTKFHGYAIYLNAKENNIPQRLLNLKTGKQDIFLNEQAIQVEICNWGRLTEKNGKFYSYINVEVPMDKVIHYPEGFRGYKWFERYTPEEIRSLENLLMYHAQKDGISLKYHDDMWDFSERAVRGEPGIWSHTSYRTDKSDAHPQPELVEMLIHIEDKYNKLIK